MEIIVLNQTNIPKIGWILYKIREQRKVPQKALSEQIKKSQSTVSGMENNSKSPRLLTLAKYLEILGCEIAIILKDPEEKETDVDG